MRTTSLLTSPRASSNRVLSRDQWKSKISPELKVVNCRSLPPPSGCSHMLEAPFWVRMYCRLSPSGDHSYEP
jgi:hypothetical protein